MATIVCEVIGGWRICVLGRLIDGGTSGGGRLCVSVARVCSEPSMATGDGI